AFAGPAKLEARDGRALIGWLTDRADAQAAGPMRAQAEIRLGSEAIAIEALKADLDRVTLEGRLAYSWASGERPARLEAVLDAPELDLDRGYALAQGLFGDAGFDWPREGALAIKIGRASAAGVEAKRADIAMRFGRQALEIDRFAIGDLGGAAVSVKGNLDGRGPTPRGTVTLALDAPALEGVATLVEKF